MTGLRVLVVHGYYRQRGGEDAVVDQQLELLARAGVSAGAFTVRSADVEASPRLERAGRYAQVAWSFTEARRLRRELDGGAWDVVHFHNLSPFLSASVVDAVPASIRRVMTVHNFRAFCINGVFLRDGRPCEDCTRSGSWAGIVHRCRDGHAAESVAFTLAQWTSRHVARVPTSIDAFCFPSRFYLQKHVDNGYPADRVRHLPNFVDDPGVHGPARSGPFVCITRYVAEKGLRVLVQALRQARVPFVFAGHGPLESWLRDECASLPHVQVLGWQGGAALDALFRSARAVVVPSIWYENQPIVGLQALSRGLPLVVSDIGGLPELVDHEVNGLRVPPNDVARLAAALGALTADAARLDAMGEASRALYEANHTPEAHLRRLLDIYATR